MKKNYISVFNFALVWVFLLIGAASVVFSQTEINSAPRLSKELRPFDFSDQYYYENGIVPALIYDRRNGDDKHSVPDTIRDRRYRNIRLRSVYSAYTQDGKIIYWNLYGELFKTSFRFDNIGDRAVEMAFSHPLYIFPSKRETGRFRQAHLINLRDSYFEKNLLGLSVQVVVDFTDRVDTPEGREEMAILGKRNGFSYDGTPIIKTVFEIEDLARKNLIKQTIKGLDNPAEPTIAIARVIQNPERGAIAPDAILRSGIELDSEQYFVGQFNCLQLDGRWCGGR